MTDNNRYFMKSGRLGFRHWSRSLLPEAIDLWGDTKVTKLISVGGFSRAEIENRLSKEVDLGKSLGVQYWPIFLLDNDNFAGCCGFHPESGNTIVLELGYHLLPEYWGKGLAREAAACCIAWARDTLKTREIKAGHHPQNAPSGKVLIKLGFRQIEDEYYPPTGLMHPTYSLLLNPEH